MFWNHFGISLVFARSKPNVRWPSPASDARVCSSRSIFRPLRTTRALSWLRSIAASRPIPEEAPVTSIVRPVRSRGLIIAPPRARPYTRISTGLLDASEPRQVVNRLAFANLTRRQLGPIRVCKRDVLHHRQRVPAFEVVQIFRP